MVIKLLSATLGLLIVGSASCLCAQDAVFDQPAVEARVHVPDLAQRINTVVEGEITGVDPRTGIFSVTGRRVPFVSSYGDAANPPAPEVAAPIVTAPLPRAEAMSYAPIIEETATPCSTGNCASGVCGTPTAAEVVELPTEVSYSPCLSGDCGQAPDVVADSPCARGDCGNTRSPCRTGNCGQTVVAAPRDYIDLRGINFGACATGNCGGTTVEETHVAVYPHGYSASILNDNGGAYRPFAFGNFTLPSSASFGSAETVVTGYTPVSSNLASTLPPHIASPACACTRIVIRAPIGNVGGSAQTQNVPASIRPSRQPAPIMNHRFFSPDEGLSLIESADMDLPTSLQRDNVLHPVEYPDSAARPWDTACNCDGSIVISPYGDEFSQRAESYSMPRGTVGDFVAVERDVIDDPLPPEHPNDTIFNVKSAPAAMAKDLHVGDKVLVGYDNGEVETPQFVIRAGGSARSAKK